MQKRSVTVINSMGVHTRPAHSIVEIARTYQSKIMIFSAEQCCDAKEFMALMMFCAQTGPVQGSELEICADGPDEIDAAEAVVRLFEDGFGEQ